MPAEKHSAAKRPIVPADLYRMVAVEDPRLSPDGAWIAFVRRTRREHDNTTQRAIWLIRPDGSGLRQFTSGLKPDTSPRWSPDGRWLAFVSARGDKPQIYLIAVDGGEALPLTYLPSGASDPAWSPDGKYIAFPLVPAAGRNAGRGRVRQFASGPD